MVGWKEDGWLEFYALFNSRLFAALELLTVVYDGPISIVRLSNSNSDPLTIWTILLPTALLPFYFYLLAFCSPCLHGTRTDRSSNIIT